jgi:hypothetical protein
MWYPQHLTILQASTDYNGDSFILITDSDERETSSLLRQSTLHRENGSGQIVINIWSRAPDRDQHQDGLVG